MNGPLRDLLRQAVRTVREQYREMVVVMYHNDADGISSGVLLKKALNRAGFKTELYCLEKLYPEALDVLFQQKAVFILGDLGSAFTRLLSEKNVHRNYIIILDHHQVLHEKADDRTLLVNPETCGYSGSTDISGAGVCYLFALELDPKNSDLCPIAMVGNSELPGNFQSLSKEMLDSGKRSGLITGNGNSKDGYEILLPDTKWHSLPEIFQVTNTLGSIGYYRDGFKAGIELFEQGYSEALQILFRQLNSEMQACFQKALASIEHEGCQKRPNLIWFDAKDTFSGMGNKVIGLFLSKWKSTLPADMCAYLLAMMNLQSDIPGIGRIAGEHAKVSGRLTGEMQQRVLDDRMAPLSTLFANAASRVGGFGDGHKVAASAVIPRNTSKDFVQVFEEGFQDF